MFFFNVLLFRFIKIMSTAKKIQPLSLSRLHPLGRRTDVYLKKIGKNVIFCNNMDSIYVIKTLKSAYYAVMKFIFWIHCSCAALKNELDI